MMLLMGMKMSFTKKPTNPITTNPIAVRTATFVNSTTRNQNHRLCQFTDRDPAESIDFKTKRSNTFAIWFVATLNETDAILSEVSERIDDGINGVHSDNRSLLAFEFDDLNLLCESETL